MAKRSLGRRKAPRRGGPQIRPRVPPPVSADGEIGAAIAALRLSPRQTAIVTLLLQDKRDKEIAAELGLSFWTVRTHLRRMFTRTHTSDRLSLALAVLSQH